jgi:2-oxoglutarate ferredoxin oxidoreductase subunit alpha
MPLNCLNDFVIRFANINGSGSASANQLLARAILRMGVPVAPRNIFPSNIQGLPTWYEIRVTEAGHLGARGGTDLMVAMNPQTFASDLASLDQGGYFFYDNCRDVSLSAMRADITPLAMPITELATSAFADPRARQLFRNIIYIGALSALIGVDLAEIDGLIEAQFKGKAELVEANRRALRLGHDYAGAHVSCPIGLRVERRNRVGERIFIDGNAAVALGAVYGGATVCAWYPITPSTSVAENFERYCNSYRTEPSSGKRRCAIVQAEDELAAIGMVIGANWNGARAFTATSGPGISLMQEFIGLAYFAEIPTVVFDVQRGGPSTGMPTRTQQSDLLSCAHASHGDTKHILLIPQDPHEAFEFATLSFDLADRLQTPVFLMLDLDIGMNQSLCEPLVWDDRRQYDRGKVLTYHELETDLNFGRYLDVDSDGIGYRTYPGTHPSRGAFFSRGTSHDAYARYTEEGGPYLDNMQRLLRKFETAKRLVPPPLTDAAGASTPFGLIFFGSSSAAVREAAEQLAGDGIAVDLLRLRAFPFTQQVSDFVEGHDLVFIVEQNRDAQMRSLIVGEFDIAPHSLVPVLHFDGTPITARFIHQAIARHILARSNQTQQMAS